jgi:hypothetical protein
MSAHFQSAHYGASHYLSSHYGREVLIELPDFTPEPTFPPGMGRKVRQKRIMEEDEVILAIIMAFLEVKD